MQNLGPITLHLFSVYDAKAAIYDKPWAAINPNVAVRDFTNAAADPNTSISRCPEDFSLWHIGTWDLSTGVFHDLEAGKICIAHAHELLARHVPFSETAQQMHAEIDRAHIQGGK